MAALGLVAYDGSGSSGSEDEDESMETGGGGDVRSSSNSNQDLKQGNTVINGAPSNSSKVNSGSVSSSLKSSVIFSKFIDDDDDDIMNDTSKISDDEEALAQSEPEANPIWSKMLPQPKKATSAVAEVEDDVEIGPIPPKKTYGDEELPQPPKPSSIESLSTTKVKGKVRISIPFLNSLDDKESEEGERKKVVQPSQKGSGLFALLPQPKNSFGFKNDGESNVFLKNKNAATQPPPRVVPNVPGGSDTSQDPQTKPSSSMARLIPDSVKNKLKRPASKLDEIRAKLSKKGPASATVSKYTKDSDSDDDDSGDFFSLDSTETIDPEALEKLKLPMQNFDKRPVVEEVANDEDMDVEDLQGYQNSEAAGSSRSDDLMKFIQPKRGKKEEVKIIDINADDLRPDNTEWLRNITDESQAPARKSKGLGGTVKRKNQITYLAFEAKAREQELKNQWAQNRANKMATNNKYGF